MAQYHAWENEYNNLKLITGDSKPQKDLLRFLKYLRKNENTFIDNLKILDLGCGTGRNTNYLQSLGNNCEGFDISTTAIKIARQRAREMNIKTVFFEHDMGSVLPYSDNTFDILLDITSSNSLDDKGRDIYLSESRRVLKTNGYFFVKALCKDGDKNAANLLKLSHGIEKDTYTIGELSLVERVFSKEDFVCTYQQYFKIIELNKKTTYTRFNNRSYKRNFWIAYLKK